MPIISLSTCNLFLKMGYMEAMQFAIDNGFQGIEIWSNVFDFWPRKVTTNEIDIVKSMSSVNHLALAVHFCDGSNNLADINKGHLAESRSQLRETINLCNEIEAGMIIIHPGQTPHMSIHDKNPLTQYPKFTLTNMKKDALALFKESLFDAAYYAQKHKIVVCLENFSHVKGCIQSSFEELNEWVDEIANPYLQIALDIGHANLEGGVEKAIGIFGSRIRHIHLNDNYGKNSNHNELGMGTINWKGIAPFLKSFNGMLVIEIFGFDDLEGSVLRSKAFLENLLKS